MKRSQPVALGGGLDLVTPALTIPPGRCIAAVNYEATSAGPRRFQGFERCDGRTKPSETSYWYINFSTGTAVVALHATVTGATSGATGIALIAGVVSSGSYGGGNAVGYLVLTLVSGTFVSGENLQVGGFTKCVSTSAAVEQGALNDTDNTTWERAAIVYARSLIATVPGGGQIRGVWVYNGARFAFRDDAASAPTICRMYKATTSGWTLQALGRKVAFTSGGPYEVLVGNTITGATSAATAVITRVFLTSGSWAAGTAAGTFYFASQVGNFVAENLNVGANLNVATIAANGAAITLLPSGAYKFHNHNFFGASNLMRMYGADGVNPGFEWDGSVFVQIQTGMAVDKPTHVTAHKQQLFLSFAGGSLQHSAPGAPYTWSAVLGAAELGIGEEITALLSAITGVLVVYGRNAINVLYGNGVDDWDLEPLNDIAGAVSGSVQVLQQPIHMDDRGLRNLSQTQAYGDFTSGSVSQLVQPLLDMKKKAGTTVTASMRSRAKDTYRLFFSDNTALSVYFGKTGTTMTAQGMPISMGMPEIMTLDLGLVVRCTCSSEDSSGNEVLLFGSDDGYVYEMDAGTSLDGSELRGYIRLAFNSCKSRTTNKQFKKLTAETDTNPTATLYLTAAYDYGDPDKPAVSEQSFTVTGGGGFLNEANWNEFFWSSAVKGLAFAYIDGLGFNISVTISTAATYEEPHTLHGVIFDYSERGAVR